MGKYDKFMTKNPDRRFKFITRAGEFTISPPEDAEPNKDISTEESDKENED